MKLVKSANKYLPQIVAMLFLAGFAVFAWTEPASAPPAGNVDPPINTGSASQIKAGALGIGGGFQAFSDAVFNGNVNVGTATIKGDGSVSTNLNADKIDGYSEADILTLGKKVCKQYTGGPKVCYPLVNKITNTYYYIDGTAINSMQGGTFYDSCGADYTTYRHLSGASYYALPNCAGDEYTNFHQGWHGYCINDINDPNLNSRACNLPDCLNDPEDGNCWYGRDPFAGPTGVPVCAAYYSSGMYIKSSRSGGGTCSNYTGADGPNNFLFPYYKAIRTPNGSTCCTIEQ